MDNIFRRNTKNKSNQQTNTNENNSNSSSIINEELDVFNQDADISSPKSSNRRPTFSDHHSASWPRLPEIAITTSHDSHTSFKPLAYPESPTTSIESMKIILVLHFSFFFIKKKIITFVGNSFSYHFRYGIRKRYRSK